MPYDIHPNEYVGPTNGSRSLYSSLEMSRAGEKIKCNQQIDGS